MSTTLFTSQRNTMKRDSSSGNTLMAAPVTSAYSGSLYVTNLVVPHNLGKIPRDYRYYYEPFKDGVIWPDLTSRSTGGTAFDPRGTGVTGPGIIAWPDEINLNIQLFSDVNTFTGTYPVYWVIYKD